MDYQDIKSLILRRQELEDSLSNCQHELQEINSYIDSRRNSISFPTQNFEDLYEGPYTLDNPPQEGKLCVVLITEKLSNGSFKIQLKEEAFSWNYSTHLLRLMVGWIFPNTFRGWL